VNETVGAAARKRFDLIGSRGPASTKVTVTIDYTFSPVILFNDLRDYCEWKLTGETDGNGDIHLRDKTFEACHKTTLWGFNTNMAFGKMLLTIDGQTYTPEAVENSGGKLYLLNVELQPGKHNFSVLAEGGEPNKEATFVFLHK